jgi:uncharacterized protein YyaL (SSP411 family)
MDRKTYDDPEIARMINDNFVAIRVDIDRRPDISERYNRGGFPTTAFLSDQGESIWGSTYIPPADMKRIIGSILQAKREGEIDQTLERNRMPYLDISKSRQARNPIGPEDLDDILEDIFATYDVKDGGFGIEPKFPHPDAIELLLARYTENCDAGIGDAVTNTLDRMTEGLYDKAEGGLFRYSVTRDWKTPHYEKMLDTNLGYLRNLVHAYSVFEDEKFKLLAEGTAIFLLTTLRNPRTGGFYGSQDADEEYYKLSEKDRKKRKRPSVDKTVYAGWNCDAVCVMILAGKVLRHEEWVEAGLKAWRHVMASLWDPDQKLVRHVDGEDILLFEDQVSFLRALNAVFEATGDESLFGLGDELVRAIDKRFANEDGGYSDVMLSGMEIGELGSPRRSLVANSDMAYSLAVFGTSAQRDDLVEKARTILSSFSGIEVDSHGLFGASYLIARLTLEPGPVTVDVHAPSERLHGHLELCAAARSLSHPAVIVRRTVDDSASKPFAVICSGEKCLPKIENPDSVKEALAGLLSERRPGRTLALE